MQFTVGLLPSALAPCRLQSAAICISSTSLRCLHVLSENGLLVTKFPGSGHTTLDLLSSPFPGSFFCFLFCWPHQANTIPTDSCQLNLNSTQTNANQDDSPWGPQKLLRLVLPSLSSPTLGSSQSLLEALLASVCKLQVCCELGVWQVLVEANALLG